MPTPSETSATRAPGPTAGAAPVARAVAEDLEAIFPNAAPAQAGAGRRLRLGRGDAPVRGKTRAEGRTAAIGALVAAAFVGVSAGLLLARSPGKPAPAAEAPRQLSLTSATLPSPGPLAPGPLHTPGPQPQPQPVIVRTELTAPAPAAAVRPRRISTQPARRPRPVRAACRGSHCGSSVMAADGRLRRAYASAVQAGVPRGVLIDYRNQWERLRHRAPREPGLVATRYDDMAAQLNRAAGRHRVAHVAPRQAPPWRSLRTEFASLWR
jgi:hypothetical protein